MKTAVLLKLVQNNKKVFVLVVYCSPSQTNDEFNQFLLNFEQMLLNINQRKTYLTLVTGGFNTRSSSWWSDDVNTTEGTKLLSLTSCNEFQQIVNKPAHIQRQSSSCIDLIFTDQPNLSVNSGIHTFLHPNCHHQIFQSKFDPDIFYLPPYQRLVWNYKKADVSSARKALNLLVNWEILYHNKNINVQVSIFNETILYIFRNFAPKKINVMMKILSG